MNISFFLFEIDKYVILCYVGLALISIENVINSFIVSESQNLANW